jgi:hypothetical protein
VFASHVSKVANLFLPGLFPFVMVQVSGVVADLVNMRSDDFCKPIVFLQVDNQIRLGLLEYVSRSYSARQWGSRRRSKSYQSSPTESDFAVIAPPSPEFNVQGHRHCVRGLPSQRQICKSMQSTSDVLSRDSIGADLICHPAVELHQLSCD